MLFRRPPRLLLMLPPPPPSTPASSCQASVDLANPDLKLDQPCQVLLPLRLYNSKGKRVAGDHGLLHVALWRVALVTPTSSVMASAPSE